MRMSLFLARNHYPWIQIVTANQWVKWLQSSCMDPTNSHSGFMPPSAHRLYWHTKHQSPYRGQLLHSPDFRHVAFGGRNMPRRNTSPQLLQATTPKYRPPALPPQISQGRPDVVDLSTKRRFLSDGNEKRYEWSAYWFLMAWSWIPLLMNHVLVKQAP